MERVQNGLQGRVRKAECGKLARSVWNGGKAERPYLSLLLVKMALTGLLDNDTSPYYLPRFLPYSTGWFFLRSDVYSWY
jgi:hypothetical protein